MIVGVTGYARHGKDTIGARLVDRWGFERFGFADALREMALTLDPYVGSAIYVEKRLGLPPTFPDNLVRLSELVDVVGPERAKELPEVRRIYQDLGTQCVRDIIGEDSWVRALGRRLAPANFSGEFAVITDVRFPNEAAAIHSWGGVVIRVVRPNFDNGVAADHPSERYVPSLPADYTILNDGTPADLQVKVDALAAGLRPVAYMEAETLPDDPGPWTEYDVMQVTRHELRPGDAVAAHINALDCE